ncbi:hypothetical protein DPMN_006348 [Dreissena polymorpha]|uniref:Uncharacterized protein n=1 Tax=Dreissena polymorpha TaxID=45954 RepID=A0A9D4MS84_DREPO|nr:hypothetical protein DPMN_006348 [Dreissena polymorpha]
MIKGGGGRGGYNIKKLGVGRGGVEGRGVSYGDIMWGRGYNVGCEGGYNIKKWGIGRGGGREYMWGGYNADEGVRGVYNKQLVTENSVMDGRKDGQRKTISLR